jgi:Na+/proline symporter
MSVVFGIASLMFGFLVFLNGCVEEKAEAANNQKANRMAWSVGMLCLLASTLCAFIAGQMS